MSPVVQAIRQFMPGYSIGFLCLAIASILTTSPLLMRGVIYLSAIVQGKYLGSDEVTHAMHRAQGAHIDGYGLFVAAILSA